MGGVGALGKSHRTKLIRCGDQPHSAEIEESAGHQQAHERMRAGRTAPPGGAGKREAQGDPVRRQPAGTRAVPVLFLYFMSEPETESLELEQTGAEITSAGDGEA